jgi:LysM repeat protein
MALEVSSDNGTTSENAKAKVGANVVKIWFAVGSSKFQLPTAPETIAIADEASFGTYTILDKGDVKIPSGISPEEITISGVLLPKSYSNHPLMQKYKNPQTVIADWQKYKEKKRRVKVSWSGIPIKLASYYYVVSVSPQLSGVQIKYDLKLVHARELNLVVKKRKKKKKNKKKKSKKGKGGKNSKARTNGAIRGTKYRVKAGDSLWSISQRCLGKIHGGWQAIAKLNHLKPPYMIHPGQVLKIPQSESAKSK